MSATPRQLADKERPWIGLASFTEGDSEFFAGRGEETEELLRLVRRDTLTLLYGVSGLGKTSLLRAGLFPRLHAEDALPVPIRLDHLDDSLALSAQVHRAIAAAASAAGVERPGLAADDSLWEYFHRAGHDFWSRRNEPVTPVLVFDQFEELFTIGRETSERARRADAFIAELADLVENRAPAALRADPRHAAGFDFTPVRLKVLISMREDYLADLDRLRSRFRDLGHNRLRLLPMGEAQARAVIAVGQPLLQPGVEDRILAFVAGNESAGADENLTVAPALLSLVLRELNERRLARGATAKITADLLDLEQMKILEGFYQRSLEGCPDSTRVFIEDALLTAGGYRNSCALDDALARDGVTQPILDELVNRRLLAYEDRHRSRRVELTHDVLVPVVKASRNARRAREERERTEKQEREALARAESARAEAEKKARAARRQLLVAGVLVAVALASAAFGLVGWFQARKAEKQVQEAAARADVDNAILLQQPNLVDPEMLARLARALRTDPDAERARILLLSLLRDSLWCLPALDPLRATGAVIEARFADGGQRIVAASRDGMLREWEARTGTQIGEHKIPEPIQTLSRDGRRVLTATADKTVQVWDVRTGQPITPPIRHDAWGGPLSTASFSADGTRVVTASGGIGGNAHVWNADTGEPIGEPTPKGEAVISAGLSHDGRQLFTISSSYMNIYEDDRGSLAVRPWNDRRGEAKSLGPGGYLAVFSDDGRRILVVDKSGARVAETGPRTAPVVSIRHGGPITSVNFSADGQWLVSGSQDRTAMVWNAETGHPRGDSLVHDSTVVAVSFSPDGRRVLTVSKDNTARVWDVDRGQMSCEPLRHDGAIATAFFDPTGLLALTASEDSTARLWNLDGGAAISRPLKSSGAQAAAFTTDGNAVILVGHDGSTQTLDVESGKARGVSLPARQGIEPSAVSANSKRLVSVSRSDLSAQVWDTQTGKPAGHRLVHKNANQLLRAHLSADGMSVVTSYANGRSSFGPPAADGTARVWEVDTGQSVGGAVPMKPGSRVDSVTADGRIIVIGPENAAQIWDARSGQPLGGPMLHEGRLNAATFSHDGHRIVTASEDKTARVWDGHSGYPITAPLRQASDVAAASFSSDGTRIVISVGREASVWDAKTGKSLGRPLRHDGFVRAAAFSADRQRIVTLLESQTHVWDVAVDTTSALPAWLPDLAEAVGGQRFNEAGVLVPANSLSALRQELMTAGAPRELKGDDFWSRFGRWFLTRGPERTISPNSRLTRAELDRLRGAAGR